MLVVQGGADVKAGMVGLRRDAVLRVVAALPPDELAALLAVVCLADPEGIYDGGQRALAEAMGIGLPAANERLGRLTARTIAGEPLITTERQGRRVAYHVLPTSGLVLQQRDDASPRSDSSPADDTSPRDDVSSRGNASPQEAVGAGAGEPHPEPPTEPIPAPGASGPAGGSMQPSPPGVAAAPQAMTLPLDGVTGGGGGGGNKKKGKRKSQPAAAEQDDPTAIDPGEVIGAFVQAYRQRKVRELGESGKQLSPRFPANLHTRLRGLKKNGYTIADLRGAIGLYFADGNRRAASRGWSWDGYWYDLDALVEEHRKNEMAKASLQDECAATMDRVNRMREIAAQGRRADEERQQSPPSSDGVPPPPGWNKALAGFGTPPYRALFSHRWNDGGERGGERQSEGSGATGATGVARDGSDPAAADGEGPEF